MNEQHRQTRSPIFQFSIFNFQFVVLAALLAVACVRKEPAPPPPPPSPVLEDDRANLLTIVNGTAVISRSYESNLESSAAHAVDSDSTTYWEAPTGVRSVTAVLSLAARTRITSVGVTTPLSGGFRPRSIHFESSVDGEQWTSLASIAPRAEARPQFFDVTPAEASYLRVTPADAVGVIGIRTLHVHGSELEPPRVGSLDGCWTINGLPARIVQNGARVIGVIGDEHPMFIDGGSDGRFFRLLWTKLPQYGFAAVAVSPDGRHLSAVRWHEEPGEHTAGDGWFGVRGACAATMLGGGHIISTFFRRAGRYPLFGLRFDAQDLLDERTSDAALRELAGIVERSPSQRFRIRSSEFREATPAANHARAQRRLDSLRAALASRGIDLTRITLVAAGDSSPMHRPRNGGMRAMYSSVDLQLR